MTTASRGQAYYQGTGRRKTAVAQVRLVPGSGVIIINGKPLGEAVPMASLQYQIEHPFRATSTAHHFNVTVKVAGGGVHSQVGAIRHGLSRALLRSDESFRPLLRKEGLLTRDARKKERKKPGLRRARKAPQYTKR